MNPWQRFWELPWMELGQAALLTMLAVLLVEAALPLAAQWIPGVQLVIDLLFGDGLGIFTGLAIPVGVGALAVVCLEYVDRRGITAGSLWGLVLCLAIAFTIRDVLPVKFRLVEVDYVPLVAMLVGVSWKGQRYWRSYRRW